MKNIIIEPRLPGIGTYEQIRKLVQRCEARGWCRRSVSLSSSRILATLADKQHNRFNNAGPFGTANNAAQFDSDLAEADE